MPEYPSIYLLPVGETTAVGLSESVVLDPEEVATGRQALDITSWVREEGIDWGDAQTENYMAEAQVGQVPVDFRQPNRQAVIPLVLLDWDDVAFAEIRGQIQAKAALFQRRGGWVKRMVGDTPVYADVVSATLKLGGSSLAARQFADNEAAITLEYLPDWYAAEEEHLLEVAS